jgi:hypothetical protein
MTSQGIAPDNLKVGMLVTILGYKPREIDCQCGQKHTVTPQNDPMCGEPFRIEGLSLPYVALTYLGNRRGPMGTVVTGDIRYVNFAKINTRYARAAGAAIPKRVNKNQATVDLPKSDFFFVDQYGNPISQEKGFDFLKTFLSPNPTITEAETIALPVTPAQEEEDEDNDWVD